jgi:biopolymer transport protein ExbB
MAMLAMCIGVCMLAMTATPRAIAQTVADAAQVAQPTELAAAENEKIPTKSIIDMFFAGGLLMYPILASSFVLVLFSFERLIALRKGHVIPRPFVRRFLQQLGDDQLEPGEALVLCEENGSHVA